MNWWFMLCLPPEKTRRAWCSYQARSRITVEGSIDDDKSLHCKICTNFHNIISMLPDVSQETHPLCSLRRPNASTARVIHPYNH